MTPERSASAIPTAARRWKVITTMTVMTLASLTAVSAHVVRGTLAPTIATAFVSSPTSGTDSPIRVGWGGVDTGTRVVCFSVANTSPSRLDRPDWPRVFAVGLELPGNRSGFTLVAPVQEDWTLAEGVPAEIPGRGTVTLDFALIAHVNPGQGHSTTHHELEGIPPGQPGVRGSGTRFCVSGPFPDQITSGQPTSIEQLLNGVVVLFDGVDGTHRGADTGTWDNPARLVPLYPE